MKIIDLLNKIANGEEVPKKIKWGNTKYTLYTDEDTKQIYYQDDECKFFFLNIKCLDDLNDEVEVIEDNKKIEMLDIELSPDDGDKVNGYLVCEVTRDLAFKINEIIEVLNEK